MQFRNFGQARAYYGLASTDEAIEALLALCERQHRTIEAMAAALRPSPGVTDTSAEAANRITPRVSPLRLGVLTALQHEPLTADEAAAACEVSILSIRPRMTEMGGWGWVRATGKRRPSAAGNPAMVWEITSAGRAILEGEQA